MGDCEGGAEADELEGDKVPYYRLALDSREGFVLWGEGAVAAEEEDFLGDSVGFETLNAHDEEETCEDGLGD